MKKALSVFLSLLMVITTISVVFTLPASAAVVNYVINENFDSYATGTFATNKNLGDTNGWISMGTNNIVSPAADTETYSTLTAVSGSNVLAINTWARMGYAFNVEPNTTYTFSMKGFAFGPPNSNYAFTRVSTIDISGAAAGQISYAARSTVKDSTTATFTTASASCYKTTQYYANTSPVAFTDYTLTFTTGADATKYIILLESENNDKTMLDTQRCFFVDDFTITYDAKPTVKTTTYGVDTKNGGVAWIDTDVSNPTEGMSVTYKARPYDSALFDGWYVNGTKVSSEATYEKAWVVNDVVEAKFKALAKNYFEDGSGENAKVTAGSSAPADATQIYKGKGGSSKAFTNGTQTLVNTVVQHKNANSWDVRTATREISADNWVGSSYGGIATNNNTYINSVAAGVTAYSGKSVYNVKQASHSIFKVVRGLEKNTDYIVTYYIYQYGASADFNSNDATSNATTSYAITGIPTNATTVYMGDGNIAVGTVAPSTAQTVIDTWGQEAEVVTNQTRLTQSYIVDGRKVLGEWTKHSVTFNTGDFTDVLVNFYSAQGTFIDHISLYNEPVAITPTNVSVSDNGMNAGFIESVTDVYFEGDTFTATAVGYDNGTFLGWYVNDQKVSDSLTYVFTYDSTATYVAKFDAKYPNLFTDGSFEGYASAVGSTPGASSATGVVVWGKWDGTVQTPTDKGWVGTQYGRGYVADNTLLNILSPGVTALSGNKVLVQKTGSHVIGRVVAVKPNTQYTLVYYTYSRFAGALSVKQIVGLNLTNGQVSNSGMSFKTDGTDGQYSLNPVDVAFDNQTVGQWIRQELTFNSGDYSNVLVAWGLSGAAGSIADGLYLDNISLFEVPVAFTPTVTVDDGGKNAGIVYDVTEVYKDGDTFSASAKAYGNGKFLGWYVGDVLASESETATLTYDSTKTYTAKFEATKLNVWPEDSAPSSTTPLYKGSGHTTPKEIGANGWTGQSWATIYNVDNDYIATLGTGLKAFAGDTAYYFSSHNGHNAYRVVRGLKTNTQYTLTYWVYHNGIDKDGATVTGDPTFNDLENNTGVNYGITGIATGATMIEVADMYVKVDANCTTYPQVRPTQSTVAKTPVAGEWFRVERTFNTGANTDFLINFGNCASTIVMYDHFALFESPVAITPTVTVDDGGMNAGFATVDSTVYGAGETFEVTANVYDNAVFAGWFANGEKVADTEKATLTYAENTTYVAKFEAQYKNIATDSSYENVALNTNLKYNASFTWGEDAKRDHTIMDTVNMVAIDRYAHNAVASNDVAYSGTQSFKYSGGNSFGNSHRYYKLIPVEPNSTYTISYYYYQELNNYGEAGFFNGESNKKLVGLNLDAIIAAGNPNAQTGESLDAPVLTTDKNNGYLQEVSGKHVYLDTEVVGDFSVTGQWTKVTLTTFTGEYDTIGVPFSYVVASHKEGDVQLATIPGVYIDELIAYRLPNNMQVNLGNTGGNVIVNGAISNNNTFAIGSTATFTAEPFPGNKFLGWYTDASLTGTPVSTEATITMTALADTVYYAKFQDNNVLADYSFENIPLGSIEELYATYGWYTEVTSGYGKDTWTDVAVVGADNGITPFDGSKMIKVNHHSNAGWFRNIAVKNNTTYTLSFKYNLRLNAGATAPKFCGVTVSSRDYIAFGESANGHYIVDKSFGNNDYNTSLEVQEGWQTFTATFNTGNLNSINVMLQYNQYTLYIDDMTLVEHPAPTVTVETIGAFGKATTAVGGRAYAIVNSDKLDEVSYHAYANEGNQFLGWYEGDTFVSNQPDVYYSGACPNLTAKFMDMGYDSALAEFSNLYSNATNSFDGSFESLNHGWLIGGCSCKAGDVCTHEPTINTVTVEDKSYYTFNFDGNSLENPGFGSIWTYSSRNGYGGIKVVDDIAHTGKQSLLIREGVKGAAVQNKLTGLNTNTDYVLSFYYYIPNSVGDNCMDEVAVFGADYLSTDTVGNISFTSNQLLNKIDFSASSTTYGMWQKVSISFNTGDLTEVILHILYSGGAYASSVQTGTNCYLDTFALNLKTDYESAANTAFNNSVERGGVAIRLPDAEGTVTQALRFKARIAKERLEAMTLGADYKVVEYGSLAMNSAYIEGDSLVEKANNLVIGYTNGGKNVIKGVTYNANSGSNKVFAYKPGERDLIFTAALTGIGKNMEGDNLAKAYTTTYVVRTYAILELADGTQIAVYDDVTADETFSASIYDVATKAIVDPKVSDVDKEYIQKQIIDVCEAASEEGVASSYSSSFTGKGLSNEEKIENMFVDENIIISGDQGGHATSAPTYYTSDNTIRVYEDNTLTLSAPTASTYALRSTGIVRIIKSIEITYKSDDYADYGVTTNLNGVEIVPDETNRKLTINNINAGEVTLTFTAKARITNIKVNYTEQAPCAEHVYTDDCDEACDNCYAVRYDAPHNFVSDCDAVCDCGETREATGEHTYEFVCSTECSVCGATREADHVYNEGFCECGAKEPTEKTVNIVTNELTLANESKVENLTVNSIVLNGSKGGHSNNEPKFFTSDKTLRAYAKNTLTVSAPDGHKLVKVVITFKSGYADEALTTSAGTITNANTKSTIVDIDAKSVTVTFTATVRITNFEVVYDIIPECAPEDHVYDNSCDTSCNVCNAQRAATHEDDAVKCDTTCSVCGEAVEATAQHTADACASACELCGAEVVPTHKFAGDCDAVCECGVERDVNAEHNYVDGACDVCGALEPVSCTHEYDNACDAECNLCFATREDITHTYISDCDTTCEYCDATREAAEHATYDNACDTTCICGAERVAPHNFTNDCQTKCADCDVTREPLADHTWTDDCDAACDVCGETRTAPHQYEFPCSAECVCGATRTPAEHDFTNGDCVCGEPKPTSTTVNVKVQNYASANSWANGTKYSSIVLDSNITATVSSGSNTGKYYTSGYEWRLYQTESAKITISAANGMIIKTIKITYNISNTGVLKLNGSNIASGSVVTVNASSIQFTVGNSGSATNGQAKITAIEVVYGEACNHADDKVACDTICSECGMTVDPTAEHTYADDCDADCDLCNTVRTAPHVAASDCDLVCENCGADLVPTADHTYDDDSDADCNLCGDVRVPPVSCDHANADACDTACLDCGADLVPAHKWASDCDTTCDCGETREALADHVYADDCDADCDLCGETRTAPHQYKYDCSDTCVCGATRTPADHTYGEDGFCECGEEKPAQSEPVTVTKTAQSYGYSDAYDINNKAIAVDDVISFTASKGSGSTTPKYYNSGTNFRIYAKNTLKFTALEGYKITSISITCSGTSYIPKSGNYTITSGSAATNSSTVTFSGVDASTWTLTNTGSSQIRITSFTIVYEKI